METIFYEKPRGPIIVFGDIMVDRTLTGTCSRLANEGAVPVFVQNSEKFTLGGCGNVAANLLAMGAEVLLFSVVGGDKVCEPLFLNKKNLYVSVNKDTTTTIKTRGFADNKLVLRLDNEASKVTLIDTMILKISIKTCIETRNPSCVVISDYNRGVCTEDLCQTIISMCNQYNIPVVVDPKVDAKKYKGCTLIKPNFAEAARITGLPSSLALTQYHRQLYKLTNSSLTCITNADKGMSLYDHTRCLEYSYKMPQVEVCDVTGAGDIVCATLAYCLSLKISYDQMVKCAVFLATQSVQHAGSYVLQQSDFWALRFHLNPSKIIFRNNLKNIPRNKKIVFTNGCFDILHKGHIDSLREAKKFGDILIVGVNSDESIRKLKGDKRPILSLDNRLAILNAIEYVDYVIVFGEDTPLNILRELRPNVYVKGEEYRGKYLEGSNYADKTEYIPFYTNVSTTQIVNNIIKTHSPIYYL
jgi:D-beta-D-heptose 7-phosphate kinase/D-beta-D-heptose 1-phosphate adenosyltransferase